MLLTLLTKIKQSLSKMHITYSQGKKIAHCHYDTFLVFNRNNYTTKKLNVSLRNSLLLIKNIKNKLEEGGTRRIYFAKSKF